MDFVELDPRELDAATADAIAEIQMAARRAEVPDPTPTTGPSVRLHLRYGWGEERPDWLTVAHESGRIVGVATLMFPRRSNRHLAYAWIDVHPDRQRHGIGSDLLTRPRTVPAPWADAA
jgi:RimJ/RimL family protein N-acetyltransferase